MGLGLGLGLGLGFVVSAWNRLCISSTVIMFIALASLYAFAPG